MEVSSNTLLPGDPRLINHIVYELKSRGIFDQFRKDCIADVDTRPAYQNLRQRVEGSVSAFLKTQVWKPDMNRNQLREMLRKNIYESGFLELGVERIVDQVVNPKINTVFLPQVEELVYSFLGVEKPSKNSSSNNGPLTINTVDLLPTDLDPISPDSEVLDRSVNKSDKSAEYEKLDESKIDDFESPPFELITEKTVFSHDENSNDSNISGISGLTSHDSNDNIPNINISRPDLSNQDSQLSKVSSNSRLSIITTGSKHTSEKMDISEETSKFDDEPDFDFNFGTQSNFDNNDFKYVLAQYSREMRESRLFDEKFEVNVEVAMEEEVKMEVDELSDASGTKFDVCETEVTDKVTQDSENLNESVNENSADKIDSVFTETVVENVVNDNKMSDNVLNENTQEKLITESSDKLEQVDNNINENDVKMSLENKDSEESIKVAEMVMEELNCVEKSEIKYDENYIERYNKEIYKKLEDKLDEILEKNSSSSEQDYQHDSDYVLDKRVDDDFDQVLSEDSNLESHHNKLYQNLNRNVENEIKSDYDSNSGAKVESNFNSVVNPDLKNDPKYEEMFDRTSDLSSNPNVESMEENSNEKVTETVLEQVNVQQIEEVENVDTTNEVINKELSENKSEKDESPVDDDRKETEKRSKSDSKERKDDKDKKYDRERKDKSKSSSSSSSRDKDKCKDRRKESSRSKDDKRRSDKDVHRSKDDKDNKNHSKSDKSKDKDHSKSKEKQSSRHKDDKHHSRKDSKERNRGNDKDASKSRVDKYKESSKSKDSSRSKEEKESSRSKNEKEKNKDDVSRSKKKDTETEPTKDDKSKDDKTDSKGSREKKHDIKPSSKHRDTKSGSSKDAKTKDDSKSKDSSSEETKKSRSRIDSQRSTSSKDTSKSEHTNGSDDLKKDSKQEPDSSNDAKYSSDDTRKSSDDMKKSSSDTKKSKPRHGSESKSRKTTKERDRTKKSAKKDDHSCSRDKISYDRRSADRDSNDGSSGVGNNRSPSKTNNSTKFESQNGDTIDNTNTNDSKQESENLQTDAMMPSEVNKDGDGAENAATLLDENIDKSSVNYVANKQESSALSVLQLDNDMKLFSKLIDSDSDSRKVKIKKPKFASNIYEARRLMKVRKKLEKLERKRQIGLSQSKGKLNVRFANSNEDSEDSLDNGLVKVLQVTMSSEDKKVADAKSKEVENKLKIEQNNIKSTVSKKAWDEIEAKLSQTIHYDESANNVTSLKKLKKKIRKRSSDEEDCLYFNSSISPETQRFLQVVHNLNESNFTHWNDFVMAPPNMNKKSAKRIRKSNLNLDSYDYTTDELPVKKSLINSPVKNKTRGMKRQHGNENDHTESDNNNRNINKTYKITHIAEEFDNMQPSTVRNGNVKIKPIAKMKKSKKNHINSAPADMFPLPLSPESDVSVSSVEVKNHIHKTGDSPTPVKNHRAPINVTQRYSSDDLYKPRLFVSGSRRRFNNADPNADDIVSRLRR